MKYNERTEYLTLSSGHSFYAHQGCIGIDEDLWLYEGYNGSLTGGRYVLTTADFIEIAEYMIARWQRFKNRQITDSSTPSHPQQTL
jgi:hypothetical protein